MFSYEEPEKSINLHGTVSIDQPNHSNQRPVIPYTVYSHEIDKNDFENFPELRKAVNVTFIGVKIVLKRLIYPYLRYFNFNPVYLYMYYV